MPAVSTVAVIWPEVRAPVVTRRSRASDLHTRLIHGRARHVDGVAW